MFTRNFTNGLRDPNKVVASLDDTLRFHGHAVDHVDQDIPTEDLLRAIGYWVTQGLDVRSISFYRGVRLQLMLESFLYHFGGLPEVKAEVVESQYGEGYFISVQYEIDGIQFTAVADDSAQARRIFGC